MDNVKCFISELLNRIEKEREIIKDDINVKHLSYFDGEIKSLSRMECFLKTYLKEANKPKEG